MAAFEATASANALKKAASSELLEAIQVVLRGDNFIRPGVAGVMVRAFVVDRRSILTKTDLHSIVVLT